VSERPGIPAASLVFFIILAVFFWGEMVFFDKIPFYRDTLLQFYPWQAFADNSIRSGLMPLWNNYSGCGTPFIGNLQSAVFYPLKLFFYFLPLALAVKLFIITNIIIAGFGMFFLLRDFRVKTSSAFFAALVFSFNGYLISRVEFWSILAASVWLPLIMFFLKRFADNYRFKYFSLAVFALTMPLLAGGAQIYFYNLLILSAFVLWYGISIKKKMGRFFGYFAGACVLSLLLSAVQLLPFLEFVMHSVRKTGIDIELASRWSLHPFKLINFLTPFFWGNPSASAYYGSDQFWTSSFYCGIPVVLLLLFSMIFFLKQKQLLNKGTKQAVIFFSALAALFFVIALGRYGFVYGLLYKYFLPFRMIRYPAVAMYGTVFAFAVLSGLLLDKVALNLKSRMFIPAVMISSILLLLVTAGSYIYMNSFKISADPVRCSVTNNALITAGALLLALAGLFYLAALKKIRPGVFTGFVSALLILDLYINTGGLLPLARVEEVFSRSAVEKYLRTDNSAFRIATSPGTYSAFSRQYENPRALENGVPYKDYLHDIKNIMHDDYSMFCGIECFNVYDPMRLKQQDILAYRFSTQRTAFETPLLNIFNVKYCLSSRTIIEKGLVLRTKLDGIFIYENKNVLPRACIVYNILKETDPAAAFRKVTAGDFMPLQYGVVEDANAPLLPESSLKAEQTGVIYSSADRVTIKVNAAVKGLCILSDSYYPGWQAELDGVATKILKTNYMFRGVIVPAGKHTVEMVYKPLAFRAGVAVSLATLGFFLLISVWIWERKISL